MKITLTILGEPASKANSRELVTMNRFSPKQGKKIPMAASIKSEKARNYEAAALLQIPPSCQVMLRGNVRVTMTIYYASERPDLDESVVLDVLQARYKGVGEERVLIRNGVYRNDRQVREKHVFHAIDTANPRAEIEVEELAPGLFEDLAPPVAIEQPRRRRMRPTIPGMAHVVPSDAIIEHDPF